MQSMQSPLGILERGHTIKLRNTRTISEDDLNDIDEQVKILDLAIDGKFDNRKSIRK